MSDVEACWECGEQYVELRREHDPYIYTMSGNPAKHWVCWDCYELAKKARNATLKQIVDSQALKLLH